MAGNGPAGNGQTRRKEQKSIMRKGITSIAKSWLVFNTIFVALGVLLCGCDRPKAETGGHPTIVGAALPLTGDAAVYGQALKNGIELALEEHNRAGSNKLSIIYEDDQYAPKMAVTAVQKLIQVDKVPLIIGGAGSTTAEPIISIITQNKVVLLSPCATAPSLTGASPYFFRLWPSDTYEGVVLAETAWNKLGIKKVAVLYVNAPYGQGITDVFSKRYQQLGGTIAFSESYAQNATDFRTQLTKIKAEGVPWVFLPGYVKEVSNILKQSLELGVEVRFLGVNSLYDPNLLKVAGKAAEGAIFAVQTYDADSVNPLIHRFVESYQTKYGAKPDAFAATGYDALRVVAAAIERSNSISGPELRDAMAKIKDFKGPSGHISFNANGDVNKPLQLMTVLNGQFVRFDKANP